MPLLEDIAEAIAYKNNNIAQLEGQIRDLGASLNVSATTIAELRAQVDELGRMCTQPDPPPPPPPAPPPTNEPVVGQPFSWQMPISGIRVTFTPTHVIKDQLIENTTNTALLFEGDWKANRAFVNCTFRAARYALWADHLRDSAFINCAFEDPFTNPTIEEAAVRLEHCERIFFQNCNIEGYGVKHAFRVHGNSANICLSHVNINSRGNGIMMGTYLGGPVSRVTDCEFSNVFMRAQGPDVFDPKRDGSVLNFKIRNMTVQHPELGWEPIADIVARPYAGWTIENLTRML